MACRKSFQTRLADSVCKQRLAVLQANTNEAQINKGLILPNGDSLLAGQGENVLGISTQGTDGVLVHKTFESKNKTVLRLLSKTQSSAVTTEAFVHVETDAVNHHRAALASFCADLNPVENCSALLVRNDDEGVFVGQGSDYGKAGLVLKLNSDLTTQWAREILPASGSTLTPVQTQVASDGSLYVLVHFQGDLTFTSHPDHQTSHPDETISGNSFTRSAIAAYDPLGRLKWVSEHNATEDLTLVDFKLAEQIGNNPTLLLAGHYSGSSNNRTALASHDGILLKLEDRGTFASLESVRFVGGTESSSISSVAVSATGQIAISGMAGSDVALYLDSIAIKNLTHSGNNQDTFLFLLNSETNYLRVKLWVQERRSETDPDSIRGR